MGKFLRKPKGPTARYRATRKRRDAAYAMKIRAIVAERDGYCRYGLTCQGRSEWAHFGEGKRFKTRGQSPERRHTTKDSLMLCTRHHRQYDAGELKIYVRESELGCDGSLRFIVPSEVYEEL